MDNADHRLWQSDGVIDSVIFHQQVLRSSCVRLRYANRTYAGWPLLRFMRDYWTESRTAPDVRHVVDFMAKELGLDKKGAKERLFRLFPYGYVKQACKIAGMQRPRVWSTG